MLESQQKSSTAQILTTIFFQPASYMCCIINKPLPYFWMYVFKRKL